MATTVSSLVLEVARVTEAAAIASFPWIGRGQEKAADRAAVDAMRKALNHLDIRGRVVIGEGERDEAPMLYIGEEVGTGQGPQIDIALDPLEGTTICATGQPNSLAVLAIAERGQLLHAPDVYMDKIAVGGGLPLGIIDLDKSPAENIKTVAEAKEKRTEDMMVCILDRPRHENLIRAVRETGARIHLIGDGDIYGAMATAQTQNMIDMYMGIGGAPEGVLACAAMRCIGGQFEGRLLFRTHEEKDRAARIGMSGSDRKYRLDELVKGPCLFSATGVSEGSLLKGVRKNGSFVTTQTLVMRSDSGTVRTIDTVHNLDKKPLHQPGAA